MMTTKLHTGIYFGALAEIMGNGRELYKRLMDEVPFLLLPDAMRSLVSARQPSHFEEKPDGNGNAWMRFPDEKILKGLTKDNVIELVEFEIDSDIPQCAISETIALEGFKSSNRDHPHYRTLRIHLLQDRELDKAVREMYDIQGRFDDLFVPRYNCSDYNLPMTIKDVLVETGALEALNELGIEEERLEKLCGVQMRFKRFMTGKEVRSKLGMFQRLGFLVMAGRIYEKFGIKLNRDWFNHYVYTSLMMTYPDDLAQKTFRYMNLEDDIEARINSCNFNLTDEEKASLGPELLAIMYDVLDKAYEVTFDSI